MKRDRGEKGKTVSRACTVASTTPPVAADVSPRPNGKPVGRALTSAATGTVLILLAGCLNPGPKFNPYIPGSYQENAFSQVKLTNAVPQTDLLKPSAALFTLGPGDKLELELLGDITTKTLTSVGPDGKIYFHLLQGVDVWD